MRVLIIQMLGLLCVCSCSPSKASTAPPGKAERRPSLESLIERFQAMHDAEDWKGVEGILTLASRTPDPGPITGRLDTLLRGVRFQYGQLELWSRLWPTSLLPSEGEPVFEFFQIRNPDSIDPLNRESSAYLIRTKEGYQLWIQPSGGQFLSSPSAQVVEQYPDKPSYDRVLKNLAEALK